jgi:hypothetical protein
MNERMSTKSEVLNRRTCVLCLLAVKSEYTVSLTAYCECELIMRAQRHAAAVGRLTGAPELKGKATRAGAARVGKIFPIVQQRQY